MKERIEGVNMQQSEIQPNPMGTTNGEMQPNQPLTLADVVEQTRKQEKGPGGRILNSSNSEGIVMPEIHRALLDKGGSLLLDLNGNVTRQNPIKTENK